MGAQEATTGAHVAVDARLDAWQAVVWNDPVNLMSYVTRVFMEYFGWGRAEAEKRMRAVHEQGQCVVAEGGREQIETVVHAMHGYGLHATMRRDGE